MNLLLGITRADIGGAQRVVKEIIIGLPASDYRITLITERTGPLVEWGQAYLNNLEVIPQSCSRREISPLNDQALFFAIKRLIRDRKIDIAHFHGSKMGFVGRLAAHAAGNCKILYTAHGWGATSRFQPPVARWTYSWAERFAGRYSDRVICVAEIDRILGEARGWIPKSKGITILNGLPDTSQHRRTGKLRHELDIDESLPIIGTVARIAEPKAPDFLLQVMARLVRMGRKLALVIIGDGPLFAQTQAMVKELGLQNTVYLLGQRTDVVELLPDFDIFTLFSRWEGLPLSIIEAMFAGLPVIASDVGGVCELVQDEVAGLIVPPMDEKAAIAGLERLLDDPDLRRRLGESGRAFAKANLTVDKMVKQYDRLYKNLVYGSSSTVCTH